MRLDYTSNVKNISIIAKYFYDCIIFTEGYQNNSFIARSFSHVLTLTCCESTFKEDKNEGT